jgi:hypothetical protein
MKKIITAVVILLAGSAMSYAQCDKKVILTGTKTEYLGADSLVQRSEEENSEIIFDKTSITIKPGDRPLITGTIASMTCNWTVPFKEGKTVLKTTTTEQDGDVRDLTITIEGKGGKITFHGSVGSRNDRIIRLTVDKFEEKIN